MRTGGFCYIVYGCRWIADRKRAARCAVRHGMDSIRQIFCIIAAGMRYKSCRGHKYSENCGGKLVRKFTALAKKRMIEKFLMQNQNTERAKMSVQCGFL